MEPQNELKTMTPHSSTVMPAEKLSTHTDNYPKALSILIHLLTYNDDMLQQPGQDRKENFRILMRQQITGFGNGSGTGRTICKRSTPRSMPTPHHSIFTGQILFLTPNCVEALKVNAAG